MYTRKVLKMQLRIAGEAMVENASQLRDRNGVLAMNINVLKQLNGRKSREGSSSYQLSINS